MSRFALLPALLAGLSLALSPPTLAQTPDAPVFERSPDGELVRIDPSGRRFPVDPRVVSARFVTGVRDLDQALEALPTAAPERRVLQGLRTLRQNRLRIADLELPAGRDPLAVVEALESLPGVEFAEMHTVGRYAAQPRALALTSDPNVTNQWHLFNDGQTGGTSDADIDAELAWTVTTGDSSVVIALIDSGLDASLVELSGNLWNNPGEIAGNGMDDDGNGLVDDVLGWNFDRASGDISSVTPHGTVVGSLCAARTDNSLGIASLAGGFGSQPGCAILVLAIGDPFPQVAVLDDAILYAVDQGADVISMSLEVSPSLSVNTALAEARDVAGVSLVGSGGNGVGPLAYPANRPEVIAVGASTDEDLAWNGGSSGAGMSLTAPGVSMIGLTIGGSTITVSGTSFSAPLVAGAIGLMRSVAPWLQPDDVQAILESTADDVEAPGFDNASGWGRLNAHKAVLAAVDGDCNGNGVWDVTDLAKGTSVDSDGNGVLDECQGGIPVCFGVACPCGNDDPVAGCMHSGGSGALLSSSGTTSWSADDLVLTVTGAPAFNSGLVFGGSTPFTPPLQVGDGHACSGGFAFRYLPGQIDAANVYTKSNLVATSPPEFINPGDTRTFQFWYRDVLCGPPPTPCPSPCGNNSNLTNGVRVTFGS